MNKFSKAKKVLLSSVLALSALMATTGATSAATPDDWNIATYTGIKGLTLSSPYASTGLTYSLGEDLAPAAYTWGQVPAGKVDYRFYRIKSDDSVQRLKSVVLDQWTIAHGGQDVYYDAETTPVTTGYPTGEYVGVYRYIDFNGSLVMERDPNINIVNTLQQAEGHILSGSRQALSNFTFFSPSKGNHQGRTGTYKVTSPSGTVLQTATFTLGANLITDQADHTKFKSQNFTTPSFAGYLNGTYKITYTYNAGGTAYVDTLNLVISGGYISSVTEL